MEEKDCVIPQEREPEFKGPIWKHPYFIYIWLTAALFLILLIAAVLAIKNNWIPNRGINS